MTSKKTRWIMIAVIVGAGTAWHTVAMGRTALAQEAAAAPTAAPATSASPKPSPTVVLPTQPKEAQKLVVAPKPALIPYGEQVYQVAITLGVDPDAGLSDREAQRLVDQLKSLVESRIGVWWNCTVTRAPAGEPLNRAMLSLQQPPAWNAALDPTKIDKKFALTLDREGTKFRLSGMEWDRASQSLTSVMSRNTFDRRLLPNLATDLVFGLFRPLVAIEKITDNSVEMRIRGGDYLPPDASLTSLTVGDYVSVFSRHLGKNRELKRIQNIPWTMVNIEEVDRSYLRGKIVSAFKSPMSGSRRRVEMLGMKIKPTLAQTRLRVVPRGKPQSPMAGYRVEIVDRLETKQDKDTQRVTLRTDRNGEIVIPADLSKPLRYLTVFSGAAPLAKAPLIPGAVARVVLEAPDDAPRLNVEAETDLLQSELIDIVAKREVLMARSRGASKKANWELVTEMEKQIDVLPTLDQFVVRIEALKNPAVQTAKKNKDKAQESRIVRMCKQISEMATLHLDPLKIKEFKTEMEENKKAQ